MLDWFVKLLSSQWGSKQKQVIFRFCALPSSLAALSPDSIPSQPISFLLDAANPEADAASFALKPPEELKQKKIRTLL